MECFHRRNGGHIGIKNNSEKVFWKFYSIIMRTCSIFCYSFVYKHGRHVSENTIVIHVKHESLHRLSALQIDGGSVTRFDQFSILHV